MFEELLKKIVSNGNNIFANYGKNPNTCLISPQQCENCQFFDKYNTSCFSNQEKIVEKIRVMVRKERLEKLLKD